MGVKLGMAIVISGCLWILRKKLPGEFVWASLWLVWTLFGALLSGRPYPHYFLQVVVPLVCLISSMAVFKMKRGVVIVGIGLVMMTGGAWWKWQFSTYPVLGYYTNFYLFITGKIATREYMNHFDQRVGRNYELAKYIQMRTQPDEKIFVWGTEPDIYVLSDRLPVGRLVTSFHVGDLNEYELLGQALELERPPFIIRLKNESRDFSRLDALLATGYIAVAEVEGAEVYWRIN